MSAKLVALRGFERVIWSMRRTFTRSHQMHHGRHVTLIKMFSDDCEILPVMLRRVRFTERVKFYEASAVVLADNNKP